MNSQKGDGVSTNTNNIFLAVVKRANSGKVHL